MTNKIAVVCLPGLETFIDPIVDALTSTVVDFEFVKCYSNRMDQISQVIQGADVVWLEWGNEMAIQCSSMLQPGTANRVILRIHSYEALNQNYLKHINWNVITDVVFVSDFIKDFVEGIIPQEMAKINVHVIPNAVDHNKFSIHESKAINEHDLTIGLLGHLNNKKGIMNLCQAFLAIVNAAHIEKGSPRDNQIKLKLGGQWQDPRYETYFWHFMGQMDLIDRVSSVNVPYGSANRFFQDVDVVLCTSPWESQNISVMEGMLCGCKPAVHHFPGAEFHYYDEFLWLTYDELVSTVFDNIYSPEEIRQYIIDRYSFDLLLPKIVNILK